MATLVGDKYLVLHGGLFSDDKVTLEDIRKLNRHNQRQPGQSGLMMEMLWTDPQDEQGRGPSKRGVGMQFGPDITKRFCENNGLEAIIRSHEVRMDGYEVASHVRNDPRLRDVPIVMITSRVGDKHRARAIELGVNDYLGKPYQESQLLEAMEPLIRRRREAVT